MDSGYKQIRTREPLYDCEVLPSSAIAELHFFNRPIGHQFAFSYGTRYATVKGYRETNLMQCGMLPHPKKFVMNGFHVVIGAYEDSLKPIDDDDRERVLQGVLTIEKYNTVLCGLPLISLFNDRLKPQPYHIDKETYCSIMTRTADEFRLTGRFEDAANYDLKAAALMASDENMIGKIESKIIGGDLDFFIDPITIKPTESFSACIRFDNAVTMKSPFRVWVFLDGIMHDRKIMEVSE